MSISMMEFRFLEKAYHLGLLPQAGDILEFGEANTARANLDDAFDTAVALESIMAPGVERETLIAQVRKSQESRSIENRYDEAKIVYRALFSPASYSAVDLLPPLEYRFQRNLNEPFDLGKRYAVVINNGTTEHVFNQANCYKAIHDHTQVGGVMVHWTPCIGWVNHGLFHVQPGFFYDLATANDYQVLLACLSTRRALYDLQPTGPAPELFQKHPDLSNAMACVVLRKAVDQPFRFPLQGKYREELSPHVTM